MRRNKKFRDQPQKESEFQDKKSSIFNKIVFMQYLFESGNKNPMFEY